MALTDLSYVPVLDTAVANENYVPQTYTEDYSADTYDVQNEYYGETYYDDTYVPDVYKRQSQNAFICGLQMRAVGI